jgi:hypothetical protein
MCRCTGNPLEIIGDTIRHEVARHPLQAAAFGVTALATLPLDEAGIGEGADESELAAFGEEDSGEFSQTVYRVHGGDSAEMGHSWTPENPAEMENPRGELGLPRGNSGEYLSSATVRNWDGVISRSALPLDGNPGGATEFLFPDPLSQLEWGWTIPLDPPY